MYEKEIEQLQEMIDESNRIVFFGGAGVSTESNIPDFRSATGIYHQKYKYSPEQVVSHSFFMKYPEAFYELSAEKSGRTLEQVKSVAVSDLELGYPISLDDRYITSLKNIEEFELNNNIITNQVDFDSWIDSSYLEKAVQEYQESAQ